jgi:hypothetical protein
VQPAWRVYAPDGNAIAGCATMFGGQKGCGDLPETGTYTLLVMDAGSRGTGGFNVGLQGDVVPGVCLAVASCIGDCDGGGSVSVEEVIRSVNIGLGHATVDLCDSIDKSRDERVSVDELVEAVENSMIGCP